jgi:hypothetical protein
MTRPAQVDPARFQSDQIVVATPHRELVLKELQSFRNKPQSVKIDKTKSDPLLGLSIINVKYEDHETDDDSARLDALMAAVRTSCQKKYAGWVPTMGKNRLLDRIDGGGVVLGGAEPIEGARPGVGEARSYSTGGGGGLPKQALEDDISKFKSVLEVNKGRGQGIKVALLDTKIYRHPDFGQDWKIDEKALLPNDGGRVPYPAGHATFVAGLIYQQAPSIDLEVFNVLNDQGEGDAWDLACKMVRWARSDDTKVLNMSCGCITADNNNPLLLSRAVEVLAPNTVIVAAAGNHGCRDTSEFDVEPNAPFWPAALDYVIGVGAKKRNSNERASFSPAAEWVRVLGPGDQVTSTFPKNVEVPGTEDTIGTYAKWSGTSFAAAAITGKIAALMADRKLPSPLELVSLSAEELEDRLEL